MAARLPLLLAVAILAAAGASANQTLALWPDGSGHAHNDHLQHRGLGFGMTQLGYLNLGEAIGEVDVKTGADGKTWVLVALLGGGFAMVDGTDPANPILVSKARYAGYGADAKLSDDATTVFLSLQGGSGSGCGVPASGMYPSSPEQMTCGDQMWDVTDRASPRFVAMLPSSSGGSHMTDYEVLNGLPTVAMAAQGVPNGVPIATWTNHREMRVVGRAEAGFVHDMTLVSDPINNLLGLRSLLIVANWGTGVTIYDITNPTELLSAADPPRLGSWPPPSGSGGNIHTVMPLALEGKRIIVAQQENFGQSVVSKLFFLDATDFGNIRLIGQWQNPDAKMANQGFVRWSTHNFNIADGKLYLAHYHGGVLVLDVSSLDKLTQPGGPPVLGNFLPSQPRVSGSFGSDVPFSWDAMPDKGVIWVTDINTGLYAVKLD